MKEDVIENEFQLYKSIQIKKSIESTWIKYEKKKLKGYYKSFGGHTQKLRRRKRRRRKRKANPSPT